MRSIDHLPAGAGYVGGIPLQVDPRCNGIYYVDFGPAMYPWVTTGPRIIGDVGSFGALLAFNLASAYRPEGLRA